MWRLVHNRSSSVQTYRSFNRPIINHLKDFILDDIQTINFLLSRLYYYSVQIAITEKASSRFDCEQSLSFLLRHFRMRARARGSVAKCRGSWVVGRGRGSWVWVWVNVVGKKKVFQKKIKRQKVVKFMKRKSPCTCQCYPPSPRSAKQISESFSTNRH